MARKVVTILKIKTLINWKVLREFIKIIIYYKNIWLEQSHILKPLAASMAEKIEWIWIGIQQKAYNKMKCITTRKTHLVGTYINGSFAIYIKGSLYQLEEYITKKN